MAGREGNGPTPQVMSTQNSSIVSSITSTFASTPDLCAYRTKYSAVPSRRDAATSTSAPAPLAGGSFLARECLAAPTRDPRTYGRSSGEMNEVRLGLAIEPVSKDGPRIWQQRAEQLFFIVSWNRTK